MHTRSISFVLPCLNEHATVADTTAAIRGRYPDTQIIVADDGSDPPISLPEDVTVIRHPCQIGNGAAIKTGARNASGDILVFMDADGQRDPADIPRLLERIDEGFDMVVSARDAAMHATTARGWANAFFNKLATFMTGFHAQDLTSAFRAARAKTFLNESINQSAGSAPRQLSIEGKRPVAQQDPGKARTRWPITGPYGQTSAMPFHDAGIPHAPAGWSPSRPTNQRSDRKASTTDLRRDSHSEWYDRTWRRNWNQQ